MSAEQHKNIRLREEEVIELLERKDTKRKEK
jgi:hypothetical protein